MTNENKIDLGNWNVPSAWDEINLKTFQEINKYYSNKDKKFDVRDVLEILCDKTRDEINQLPMEFLDIIMSKLSFLEEEPNVSEPSNKIEIDGETYIINVMEKLKTGEYVAADSVMKSDKYDYASILAILCRKENEVYDSKFEAEEFEKRKKMFENEPVVNILPIIGFFLNCYMLSAIPSLLYSEVEEELNRIQQNIDSSTKIGVFKKRYLNWQMKKLRKSLKSNKNIWQIHYSS